MPPVFMEEAHIVSAYGLDGRGTHGLSTAERTGLRPTGIVGYLSKDRGTHTLLDALGARCLRDFFAPQPEASPHSSQRQSSLNRRSTIRASIQLQKRCSSYTPFGSPHDSNYFFPLDQERKHSCIGSGVSHSRNLANLLPIIYKR